MNYLIGLSFIQGIMFGIEFPTLFWKNVLLVFDLGIIRLTLGFKW